MSFSRLKILHVIHENLLEEESKLMLQDSILKFLNEGLASRLKYIIFDDDPAYEILTKPVRRLQVRSLVGYIANTVLFGEKMFSWMGKA